MKNVKHYTFFIVKTYFLFLTVFISCKPRKRFVMCEIQLNKLKMTPNAISLLRKDLYNYLKYFE